MRNPWFKKMRILFPDLPCSCFSTPPLNDCQFLIFMVFGMHTLRPLSLGAASTATDRSPVTEMSVRRRILSVNEGMNDKTEEMTV